MSQATEMSPATTRTLRIAGWSLAAVLLALPAVAMQFSSEPGWSAGDFVFAAIVFGIVGGSLELAARASTSVSYRVGAAVGVGTAFLLLWTNAAMGIVGGEDHAANGDYLVVLVAAVAGALISFGDPRLLLRAMSVTAGAHVLIGALHLRYGLEAAAINAFFVALWAVSALLFFRAARERESAARADQS